MPTALLVEDDAATRRALTAMLERDEFSTTSAADLDRARSALASGTFDVLVLDVHLGDGTGIDLLLELPRDQRPQVILMSGDESVRSAFGAMPLDQLEFLRKPIDSGDLRRLLQQVRKRCKARDDAAREASESLVGESTAIRRLRQLIDKVAPTELSVYVEGESGTGKELVARAIHANGPRQDGPFVAINCGALPENLIDSELFGHEKGAFTGADAARAGVFERANGGTLFLDEVAEMPVELQTRLLRALETRTVRRVGGSRDIRVDVRLVSATNRPFDRAIADGTLREDLFHRLCVFPIVTPPLRDRGDDVLLLAERFLETFAGRTVRPTERTAALLRSYGWPGNVRQLRNAMQHAAVLADGDTVSTRELPAHLLADADVATTEGALSDEVAAPTAAAAAPIAADDDRIAIDVGTSIQEAERRLIEATLEAHDGDKRSAAEVLGVSLRTLYNRLNSYDRDDGDVS
ncbi:MAG: sigma-54-dependent transcriptional regulator [Planctomycetota bacterium]